MEVPAAAKAGEDTAYDFTLKALSVTSTIRTEERGAWRRLKESLEARIAVLEAQLAAGGGGEAGEGEGDEDVVVMAEASSQALMLK